MSVEYSRPGRFRNILKLWRIRDRRANSSGEDVEGGVVHLHTLKTRPLEPQSTDENHQPQTTNENHQLVSDSHDDTPEAHLEFSAMASSNSCGTCEDESFLSAAHVITSTSPAITESYDSTAVETINRRETGCGGCDDGKSDHVNEYIHDNESVTPLVPVLPRSAEINGICNRSDYCSVVAGGDIADDESIRSIEKRHHRVIFSCIFCTLTSLTGLFLVPKLLGLLHSSTHSRRRYIKVPVASSSCRRYSRSSGDAADATGHDAIDKVLTLALAIPQWCRSNSVHQIRVHIVLKPSRLQRMLTSMPNNYAGRLQMGATQ